MSRWHPTDEEIDDTIDTAVPTTTRGRVLARHLAQCEQCTRTREGLQNVRARLQALRDDELPLPAGWDDIISGALAQAEQQGPLPAPRSTRTRTWFALAASAALLVAVGGGVWWSSASPDQPSAAKNAVAPQRTNLEAHEAPKAQATPAADAGAEVRADQSPHALDAAAGTALDAVPVLDSGTDYRPASVDEQARATLAEARSGSEPPNTAEDAALAQRCARIMTAATSGGTSASPTNDRQLPQVLVLDRARWQQESAVIVLTEAATGNGMDVWVMPARCEGEERLAKVADVATQP
ncbi:MAG: hypothetical protein CSA58_06590 [Micrococcales bacterium]|nr:MAG: hypothetical protein CSB46_06085 [Micrococcales bacterium]PIE27017.1 MAG: hypothetical protein CSA58_06590 [Micrococcales bacterium]